MNIDPHFPTPYFKNYATLTSAAVCATDDPAGKGRKGIGFYSAGAGTVVVRPPSMTDRSRDEAITMIAGGKQELEFGQIVSGTATNVVVYWSRSLL